MKKRLKGLSLFANVGIAEAYLEDIGIDIVLANEIESERCEFYRHLYPNCHMIDGDISDKKIFHKIIEEAKKEEIDLIMGTPPCQGMSRNRHGIRDIFDERNELIVYVIEMVKILKPKFILLENVPRQLKTTISIDDTDMYIPDYIWSALNKEYVFSFLEDSKNFDASLYNAAEYGVPQSRVRSIFTLVRKDLKLKWPKAKKVEKIVTMKDAIGDLPSIDPFVRQEEYRSIFPNYEKKKEQGLIVSKWHKPPTHSHHHIQWMMKTPSGKSAFENNVNYPKKPNGKRISGRISTYKRYSWDKPAQTITQNNGVISSSVCVHPGRLIAGTRDSEETRVYSEPRVLTIYELMLVSSLPKNWDIPEWASETLIRKAIGEGIPPLLIKKIFLSLLEELQRY